MCTYHLLDVLAAAIAHFDSVAIEYFSELMMGRELLVNDVEESFAYVGCYTSIVNWVIPYNLSVSRSFVVSCG